MNFKRILERYSPVFLTGVAAVGVVCTAITAAKAGVKAKNVIKANEDSEEMSAIEKAKLVAPIFLPTAAIGMSTMLCIISAQVLNNKKQFRLTSAYLVLNETYKEYREKLIELYGKDTDDKIIESIAIERGKKTYISSSYMGTNLDLATENENPEYKLFYDAHSRRFFESTIEQVISAEYHLNRNYILRGYAPLNELYDFLGLEPTCDGDMLTWEPTDEGEFWIEFNHRKSMLDDGREFYILELPFEPMDEDERTRLYG